MPFRTYADVRAYLDRVTDYERQTGGRYTSREYNLKRMTRLLEALDHPEKWNKAIHVAGTKGKGSTCHILEAILRAHGIKTGLYTSPHLVDMLERIRVDGNPVGQDRFVDTLNRMRRAMDRIKPTYFEIMTAAAYLLFGGTDIVIMEAGMGGRLDATNVLAPAACVITRIDYDHMDKLGNTLAEIATEKAGIIKAITPVFTSETKPEPLKVIRAKAEEEGARLTEVHPMNVIGGDRVTFTWKKRPWTVETLGKHQAENAALALSVAEFMLDGLDAAKTAQALAGVVLPGRVQRVAKNRIVDVAHNPLSMRATADAVAGLPRRHFICVFGSSADKDYRKMLKSLKPDLWIFTKSASPRAAEPEELARHAHGTCLLTQSVSSAVGLVKELAKPEDLVLYTGSFYVAGEVLGIG